MINILYVLPQKSIENSPVLQSQVLEPAILMAEMGVGVKILCFEEKALQDLSYYARLKQFGISMEVDNTKNLLLRLLSMRVKIARLLWKGNIDVLYFRNIWGGILVTSVLKRNIRKLYDLRAVIAEESALRNNRMFLRYYVLKNLERFLLTQADQISVVSKKLKKYVIRMVADKAVQVVPSAVNTQKVFYSDSHRAEIRSYYSINQDDVVLIYIGSASKWQQLDVIIQLFGELVVDLNNLHLMIITKNVDEITKKYGGILKNLRNVHFFENIPHEEMYKYLSAADIGLLIRSNHIVNHVASPIKFGEYLACGVPVLITPWVGDFSEQVKKYQLGEVIDINKKEVLENTTDLILNYQKNRESYKTRCINFAGKYLSWKSNLRNILEFYQSKELS